VALALSVLWMVLLLVLLRWQRWRDERAWPAWLSLAGEREAQERYLRVQVERQLGELEDACALARLRHASGRMEKARLLAGDALEVVELVVSDLVDRLRQWSRIARALARVAPVARVPMAAVRGRRLKGVMIAWAAAESLLAGARERFRLRAWMLAHALGATARGFRALFVPARGAGPHWPHVDALRGDLGTLASASLDTHHALLLSLELRERDEP
jgi:hypothetical protein